MYFQGVEYAEEPVDIENESFPGEDQQMSDELSESLAKQDLLLLHKT